MRQRLLGLCVALSVSSADASVIFTKIVDTDTLVPGTDQTFREFDRYIAIEGEAVVFGGAWGDERVGLFAYDGTLEVLVDPNTLIPGGEGTFALVGRPALAGGETAFLSAEVDDDYQLIQNGVYNIDADGIHRIADLSTTIPGADEEFAFITEVARSDSMVAFKGQGAELREGIYAWDGGELSVVADENTAVPGSSATFLRFWSFDVDGHTVAFDAGHLAAPEDYRRGIYGTAGGLHVIVDDATMIPGGENPFAGFRSVSADEGAIAFVGAEYHWWSSPRGVYTTLGGLRAVAERGQPVPGGSATFRSFSNCIFDDDAIVFTAGTSDDEYGAYAEVRGTLIKLFDRSDFTDGDPTLRVSVSTGGPHALDDRRLALFVRYEDESQFIYIATICLADLDSDGTVNGDDLETLLSNYGSSGMDEEHGDINGDGVVDLRDLAILLSNFGQTCW